MRIARKLSTSALDRTEWSAAAEKSVMGSDRKIHMFSFDSVSE